jgi:hypothetical protein
MINGHPVGQVGIRQGTGMNITQAQEFPMETKGREIGGGNQKHSHTFALFDSSLLAYIDGS